MKKSTSEEEKLKKLGQKLCWRILEFLNEMSIFST